MCIRDRDCMEIVLGPYSLKQMKKSGRISAAAAVMGLSLIHILTAYVGTEDDVLLETPLSGTLCTGYTRLYIPVVVSAPGCESCLLYTSRCV